MTMLFSTLVNLICSPTFIFVFGWGIRGAALGTVCAQLGSSGWILFFLIRKERVIGLKWKYLRLRFSHLAYVIQLGMPNFLMSISQSLLSVTLNKNLLAYGGDVAMSAWGITNNIDSLISQPVFGFNQGAQPIIGYNIGAKNYARVKMALYCSLGTAMFFSTIGWLLTRLFPAQIFAFFNNDPELIAVGVRMMTIFRAFLFVVGFQQMGSAYFQFVGKPKVSIVLTLSRQVLILMPCVVVMSRLFGFDGLLYSGPISDFASMALTAYFVVREIKRLNRLQMEELQL
jgi:Na+-driven multidrug efflux pump